MAKTIWNRETGEPMECESVDAREILAASPDLYSDVAVGPAKRSKAAVQSPAAAETEAEPEAVAEVEPDLTDREINADLEAAHVEFDSREPAPVRLAQRKAGRAAKGR